MTEKHYGGTSSQDYKEKDFSVKSKSFKKKEKTINKSSDLDDSEEISKEDLEILKKVGSITAETVKYAKSFIKSEMPLLEIAEKIEAKIQELGAKPAFPVNLSINEIAAHSTPSFNSTDKAHGLLKVDLGCHISGLAADTAFSLDLENSEKNKKLIEAAESALNSALKIIKSSVSLGEIGKEIESTITSFGFQPIHNLSGHSISPWNLHSGITVPNYNTEQLQLLTPGLYAIEPFATSGEGAVRDGKLSGIYHLEKPGNVRDSFARQVLEFIEEEYQTLPFASRWIHKKFGSRGLLALRQIESAGLLHHYPQLIERSGKKVSQAEHTVIITRGKAIITTL